MRQKKLKIAIVGSGISGSTAAYLLSESHDITVYEKNDYMGGHVNTVDVDVDGKKFAIDTGFIVFNDKTYPNFMKLLHDIGQETQNSTMSFSVKNENINLEYNGSSLNGLFSQRANIFRPSFLRMIRDIIRFNKNRYSSENKNLSISIDEFLEKNNYSNDFTNNYLLPMASSIWSAKQDEILNMPVRFLLRFFDNHGLLQLKDRPQWMVIKGGSKEYLKKLSKKYMSKVHLSSRVTAIYRNDDFVEIDLDNGSKAKFDYVFIATHSDQALKILNNPSQDEINILSKIRYQENVATLHTDSSFMPKSKRCWASWNYYVSGGNSKRVNLTYCMNILQDLTSKTNFLVTLNDDGRIDRKKTIKTFNYHHPIFDNAAVKAQKEFPKINGSNRTFYVGAYWGNGFHEDGVQSAINAHTVFKDIANG